MIGNSHTPRRALAWVVCALAVVCVLSGCDRGQIQVYRVPKQTAAHTHGGAEAPAHGGEDQAASLPKVRYKVPAGWKEEKAQGLRVARFSVPGPDGVDADISVIPLPAMAGDVSTVIDMWRETVGLPPLGQAAAAQSATIPVGDGSGLFVDMASTTNMFSGSHLGRIVAVIRTRGNFSWFVKMMGAESHLSGLIEPLKAFVAGLEFEPEGVPTMESSPGGGAGGIATIPEWTIPNGWRSEAAPAMALAGFSVGQDAARAIISVTRLAGDGGGAFPNIQRWRGQLGLPEVPEKELAGQVQRVSVVGTEAMVVDMTGTDRRSGQPSRMVGAIVLLGGNSWFFKMQGDPATVEKEKGPFVEFVRTARYPNG